MKNKREHRKVMSFILTLLLLFTTVLPVQAVYGEGLTTLSQRSVVFHDIKGHWAEAAIKEAVNVDFVKGYTDGSFRPNNPVSRAEFVSMVNNALQLRQENKVQLLFTDVSENAWYHGEIAKASYVRYISGTSNTSFLPEANITRQDAATILSRFLPKAGFTDVSSLSRFPDQAMVGDWAKEGLAVVVNKGYMSGHRNGNLSPLSHLTRAEAVTMINSLLAKESIIREDVSIKTAGELLENTIYVGDITIEPSVAEGDAALENISALSKVYVLGGGVNTVNVKDSFIIQLIVAKESTKVRVRVAGDSNIHYTLVFNGNIFVDKDGNTLAAGASDYDSIVYIGGNTSIETARRIAEAITTLFSSTGTLNQDQVYAATASISTNFTLTTNPDGSITIIIKRDTGSRGATPIEPVDLTAQELLADDLIKNHGYIPIATRDELDKIRSTTSVSAIFGAGTRWEGTYAIATGLSGNYVMVKDIDLNNVEWDPIGDNTAPNWFKFTGILQGNNYSISNLTVSKSGIYCVGLFGSINGAKIENLTLKDVAIVGGSNVGALVGRSETSTITAIIVDSGSVFGTGSQVGGVVGENNSSTVSNSYNASSISGGAYVGGVVGENNSSTVSNSYNASSISALLYVGGVIGGNNSSLVSNCYNTGSVSQTSIGIYNGAGGLIGANISSNVSNCYNTGSVFGTGYSVGGVIGDNNTSMVFNSYNTGSVSGTNQVGGVVGHNSSSTVDNCYNTGSISGTNQVGGVAGFNNSVSTVDNSYNTGSVSGTNQVGGVVGNNNYSTVLDCYWLEGTNLTVADLGIGSESANNSETPTFSAISTMLNNMYNVSMSGITTSAGGVNVGSITGIGFGTEPNVSFSAIQGSYFVSDLETITVSALGSTTVTAITSGAVSGLTGLGDAITVVSDGDISFNLSSLSAQWILIKVESILPELDRHYVIYNKAIR